MGKAAAAHKKPPSVAGTVGAMVGGIAGWLTFQARCRRRPIYSEYYLYGPLMEIAAAQGWEVECEVKVPGRARGRGDKKRVDFVLQHRGETSALRVGIEVKWVRDPLKKNPRPVLDVSKDIKKLVKLLNTTEDPVNRAFLLIVGADDHLVTSVPCKPDKIRRAIKKVAGKKRRRFAAWLKTSTTNWGAVALEVDAK